MKRDHLRKALARLFDVVVREAERNEGFARRLAEALEDVASAAPAKPAARSGKSLEAPALHAVNLLRTHGENVLRGKLEQIRQSADLRAVAKASGLVLAGSAARSKASRAELIDGIVAAAKHYDAQRTTASA